METVKLSLLEREQVGDGPARRLRAAGLVPGVLYGKGFSQAVAARAKDFRNVLAFGRNVVLELELCKVQADGKWTKAQDGLYGIIKEVQHHPTREEILHFDLQRVDLEAEVETEVPLELVGRPIGEQSGGVVDWELRHVTVRGRPLDLPPVIEVDVSNLDIGDHLAVADLKAPQGVTILDEPETVVVSILAPEIEAEEAAEAGAGE